VSLHIDRERYEVTWCDRPLGRLTRKEFELLDMLAARPGVVRTRKQILEQIWDESWVYDRSVDTMVKRLRNKFRAVDPDFDAIETLYGIGYCLKAQEKH
jgi:two-component system, OmpR family, response regulator ChvI